MPSIDESIEIDRPREEVFAYAVDPANIPEWQSNVVDYEQQTPGEREVGARDRGVVRVAGKKLEFTQEVQEYDPPSTSVMRSVEAPMDWTYETRFEELDANRTRVTIHQDVDELGGFFGRLGDAVVVRMYSRDVRGNLENLKTVLEG